MSQQKRSNPIKGEHLKKDRALNPHPEKVKDDLFFQSQFFDPSDLVQVKYEMLRRVQQDRWSISDAAKKFGFSRPSFYQAQAELKERGLPGLLSEQRGPKNAHKLSEEVMSFIEERLQINEGTSTSELVAAVLDKFRINVHPRSIERALLRRKKKRKKSP